MSGIVGLQPILVWGMNGRSGTTLMMQLLGTSRQVAVDRTYPYEHRYFSYLLEWSRVIERERWSQALWPGNATETLPQPHGLVGPVPWADRSLLGPSGGQSLSEHVFAAAWEEFSRRAAEQTSAWHGKGGEPVTHYAEKATNPLRLTGSSDPEPAGLERFLSLLLDPPDVWRSYRLEHGPTVRMIALVRDPRDAWLSSVAFHEKRAGGFLPVAAGQTTDDLLEPFIAAQKPRMRWIASLLEAADTPVVRYEDLAMDLAGQATRLGEWLGISLDARAVLDRRHKHSPHLTTPTLEASVERWKREMSPDVRVLFERELAAELESLGYEV